MPFIAPPVRPIRGIIPGIGSLGLLEQRLDLGLQPGLLRDHAAVAHRLVLRGIRLDLGPIQGDVPQFHQTRPLAELQDLDKQVGQSGQMLFPKVADRPEIRPLVRRQDPKGHILLQFPRNLPRRRNPHGVGIEQHLHQQLRMIRGRAAHHPAIGRQDGMEVQGLHQIRQEVRQVLLRQPVARRRRQQQQVVGFVGTKAPSRHHAASSLITT